MVKFFSVGALFQIFFQLLWDMSTVRSRRRSFEMTAKKSLAKAGTTQNRENRSIPILESIRSVPGGTSLRTAPVSRSSQLVILLALTAGGRSLIGRLQHKLHLRECSGRPLEERREVLLSALERCRA